MGAPCTSPAMRRRQKADRSCMLPPLARPVSCQATTADNNWPAVKSYLAFLCISSSYLSENFMGFFMFIVYSTHTDAKSHPVSMIQGRAASLVLDIKNTFVFRLHCNVKILYKHKDINCQKRPPYGRNRRKVS